MAVCEFSGEECDSTIKIELAGAILNVSQKYAHLGKRIDSKEDFNLSSTRRFKKTTRLETSVIKDAHKILQKFMTQKNMSIKQLAHNSNVKEGTLQKMLTQKIPFDVKTAQAIEKSFDITLTEESDMSNSNNSSNVEDYTLNEEEESSSNMGNLMKDILNKIKK